MLCHRPVKGGTTMYKRVLVTLDGSRTSEAILDEVAKLGAGVHVTLLTVGREQHATVEDVPHPLWVGGAPAPGAIREVPPARTVEDRTQAFEHARDQLSEYLESCATGLREKGLDVEVVVRFGEPVEEILAEAKESKADLIMMATHGHSALAQVIFGSVASRVVGSGVRPVLLVRPRELRGKVE